MNRHLWTAVAALTGLAMTASACSSPGSDEDEDKDSDTKSLSVGWNQPYYSYNTNTSNGNNVANANVLYLTTGGFNYYDADAVLQKDETFGTYEKVSDKPLTIKYTVADESNWSDGNAVGAEDLLLYWAATSGQFNTVDPAKVERDENGLATGTKGEVFFDAAAYTPGIGLALVTKTPEISDDGKSITFVYDKPYAEWELDFTNAGTIMPAHVNASNALGIKDGEEAEDALVKAIQDKDDAQLAKISAFWNTGWDMAETPKNKSLLVGNGPFLVTEVAGDYVTMKKNPDYVGMRETDIDELTIRFNEDPTAQLQALRNGEISMMYPQVTEDVVKEAEGLDGVQVDTAPEGTFEHLDLTFNNGGPFDPAAYGGDEEKALKVRQAFLTALPRKEVVDKLIKPIQEDAVVRESYLVVPGYPGYDEVIAGNGSDEYATDDVEKAKALLEEAGVSKPEVKIMYADENVRRADEFKIYEAALEKAGFVIEDGKDAKWSEKLGNKSYDAVFFAWQSTSTSVMGDAPTYVSGAGNNLSGYSNTEVDALFDEIAFTLDEAKKQELIQQIDQLLFADAYGLPLFQFPSATIYDTEVVDGVNAGVIAPTMFTGFWEWELQ